LDVGCGNGRTHEFLHDLRLQGVDVSEPMVRQARTANPNVEYRVYDGKQLPYDDGSFDLAFSICVLHHVDRDSRLRVVRELGRVVRRGGLVAVFEHNPWNPLTRKAVAAVPFDAGVELLSRRDVVSLFRSANLDVVEAAYMLFFPWPHRIFEAIELGLGWLPLGAQHVVAGRRRR